MEAGASDAEATREEELLYLLTEGSDLLRAGQVAEARQHFERALTLEAGNEQALNLLGLSQFRLGELDEATRIFEGLIHNNPVEPSLRLNLAMVYLKTERLDDARRALETVLDLNPDHPRAASYMGLVLERLGALEDAAPWYERAGNPERAAQVRERVAQRAAEQSSAVDAVDDEDGVLPASEGSFDADIDADAADEPSVELSADAAAPPSPSASSPDTAGSEAAALTAARVESLNRPAPPPSAEKADAARAASLGYTFDDPEATADEDAPADDAADAVPVDKLDDDLSPEELASLDDDLALDDELTADLDEGPASLDDAPATSTPAPADIPPEPAPAPAPAAAPEAVSFAPAVQAPQRAIAKLSLERLLQTTPAPPPTGEVQPVGDGTVALSIREILYLRTDRLLGLTGELEVEPINRRYRGRRTDSLFGGNDKPMSAAMGHGMALLNPGDRQVSTLRLESEDLYLVEEHLLAFTDGLVWENGRLPAEDGEDLDIVHLRGTGDIVLVTQRAPMCLDVRSDRPVTLHAHRLIGWNGQVVPFRGPFPGLPDNAKRPPIVRFEGSGLVLCG